MIKTFVNSITFKVNDFCEKFLHFKRHYICTISWAKVMWNTSGMVENMGYMLAWIDTIYFTFCRVPSCPIHIPFIIYILYCHYFSVSNYLLGCQKGTKGQQKTLKQIIPRVQVRFNGVAKIDPNELNYSIDFFSFERAIFLQVDFLNKYVSP